MRVLTFGSIRQDFHTLPVSPVYRLEGSCSPLTETLLLCVASGLHARILCLWSGSHFRQRRAAGGGTGVDFHSHVWCLRQHVE